MPATLCEAIFIDPDATYGAATTDALRTQTILT
jgi:hypothetical protein